MPRILAAARQLASTRPLAHRFKGASVSSPDIDCHGGITTDGTFYYGIDTGTLKKFDANWNLVAQNTSAASQAGIAHLGGGQYYNGLIYIAAENYTSDVDFNSMRIATFNASDLSFVAYYDISAQGAEISDLCIDPAGTIYVCNYVTGDKIYKYSLASPGTYLGAITLRNPLDMTQGIAFKSGVFCVAEDATKRIYRVSMTGELIDYVRVALTNQQGIDFAGSNLLSLDDQGTNEVIWTIPPDLGHFLNNGNLVYNGDFERYPASSSTGTTADNRWIDGTTGASPYVAFAADSYYGWATNNAAFASSAKFDTSTFFSGTASMKLASEGAGKNMEVAPYRDDTNFDHQRYGIRVQPGRSYTFTYRMKTNVISGDSNDGAFMSVREFNGIGGNTATTNHTKVKVTSDWTLYTLTFTTNVNTQYAAPRMNIVGNTGAATLNMEAWFDELDLRLTTPVQRSAA